LEFATKQDPTIADEKCFNFVANALTAEEARVKWESAKVIGNVAHLFPQQLDEAIINLLANSEHPGTVVRWSAAFALGEILKLKTKHNKELLPAIESIINREEQNSIRKIYLEAIKKVKK
jgi:HEAT repeat protein